MGSEVVDDAAASLAPDHRRVEASRAPRELERARPRDGLAAEPVDVRVVLDPEGHVAAALREHDPPPRAQDEERHRERRPAPELLHHALADRGDAVGAREAEPALDLGVQAVEVSPERPPEDRAHRGGLRRQRPARGRSRRSDSSGEVPSSTQSRSRSKLHAVAHPRSGRNAARSSAPPAAPQRVS